MKTLKEQIAELRAAGYRALPAQAKVAHDAVLLAMLAVSLRLAAPSFRSNVRTCCSM